MGFTGQNHGFGVQNHETLLDCLILKQNQSPLKSNQPPAQKIWGCKVTVYELDPKGSLRLDIWCMSTDSEFPKYCGLSN